MKKNVIYFLLLCVLFGLILFWWKYMQYERMTQELLKENDMLKMEQTLLLEQCYQVYTPADWFHADQIFVDCYTCTQKKGRNFDVSRTCYRN